MAKKINKNKTSTAATTRHERTFDHEVTKFGKMLPKDQAGKRLRLGDVVRIVELPRKLPRRGRTMGVFRHALGTYRRIKSFDRYGLVEIMLQIRSGPNAGIHFLYLEPWLVKLKVAKRRRIIARSGS